MHKNSKSFMGVFTPGNSLSLLPLVPTVIQGCCVIVRYKVNAGTLEVTSVSEVTSTLTLN